MVSLWLLAATFGAVFFAGYELGRRVEAQSWCQAAKEVGPYDRLTLLNAYKKLQGWR